MKLISFFNNEVLLNGSTEKIISILSIALVTIITLLILSLIKVNKLKAKIKRLENK